MNKIKLLFLALFVSFHAPSANAQTSYSRLLARIQSTYLPREAAPYPILIMDRDDLEWRFALAGATGSDSAPRIAIVRAYVEEKTGVRISENAATNFEPYLTILKDAAVAMPAIKDGTYAEPEMCAVFPPDANRNQRLEHERVLQLKVAEAYGTHSFAALRETLSYDDAVLFSILHEAGHCLDRFYFPKLLEEGPDASGIHLSESFAEIASAFLMAKEGRTTVAGPRAYLRYVYSYFMEPYFARHPELGLGNEAFVYGGLIYHLSPSLRAADALIQARGEELRGMPLTQILSLAHDVVEANALPGRFLTALYAGYSEGHEAALARYRDFEERMPDLFAGYSARLETYWREENAFRESAFRSDVPEAPATGELLPFDTAKACASLRQGETGALLDQVEALRQDLQKAQVSPEVEAQRFSLLSNLWSTLPAQCQGKVLSGAVKARAQASQPFMDLVLPKR